MPIFLQLPLRITFHYATQTTSLPRKTSHHLQRAFLMWHDEKARKPQKHKAGRMKQILWDVMDVKEDIKNIKRKTIFLLRRKGNWMKIKAIGGVESPWRHNEVVCSMANWFSSHFNLSRKPFHKPLPVTFFAFIFRGGRQAYILGATCYTPSHPTTWQSLENVIERKKKRESRVEVF